MVTAKKTFHLPDVINASTNSLDISHTYNIAARPNTPTATIIADHRASKLIQALPTFATCSAAPLLPN